MITQIQKCSVLFNVVLVISLLLIVFIKEKLSKRNALNNIPTLAVTRDKNSSSQRKICFSCDLGSSIKLEDTLYDEIVDRGTCGQSCCVFTHSLFGQFIEEIVDISGKKSFQKDEVQNTGISHWRSRPNSIHAYFRWNKESGWSTDGREVSFENGITLRENRLKVRISGTYFIYLSVTHDLRHMSSVEQYYHMVTKRHKLLPMTGTQTLIMDKNGGTSISGHRHTSFLCGSFLLRNGHEIEGYISNISHVDRSIFSNYFGMFKIN